MSQGRFVSIQSRQGTRRHPETARPVNRSKKAKVVESLPHDRVLQTPVTAEGFTALHNLDGTRCSHTCWDKPTAFAEAGQRHPHVLC